jgi:hypothetical protein
MKVFNNFKDTFNWVNSVIKKTSKEAIPLIAKQEYEDSKKYTYIDTGDMYNSGQNSDFEKGIVLIKAPQVRWLYYTAGIKPHKNKNAIPQWHEATKRENMRKYENIYINNFNKTKKGVM